jgi:hypothetical protein
MSLRTTTKRGWSIKWRGATQAQQVMTFWITLIFIYYFVSWELDPSLNAKTGLILRLDARWEFSIWFHGGFHPPFSLAGLHWESDWKSTLVFNRWVRIERWSQSSFKFSPIPTTFHCVPDFGDQLDVETRTWNTHLLGTLGRLCCTILRTLEKREILLVVLMFDRFLSKFLECV